MCQLVEILDYCLYLSYMLTWSWKRMFLSNAVIQVILSYWNAISSEHRTRLAICTRYKALNDLAPAYLTNLLSRYNPTRSVTWDKNYDISMVSISFDAIKTLFQIKITHIMI